MIKAVLFDLDNTLIDFINIKIKCIKDAINAMRNKGLNLSEEDAFSEIILIYTNINFEYSEVFQDFLKKVLGRIDYKLLSVAIVAYRKTRANYVKPFNNVKKTLEELRKKGLKLGIITDAPKIKAWIRIASMELEDYFDFVIAFEDTNEKKPSMLPFKKALNELKISPEQVLFVGDNPERDIKGAKQAGMKTALAKYGQFLDGEETADYELTDIKDLIKII